jgi:prepilin-type N-terminal cleavage/methylation domain-containing protein
MLMKARRGFTLIELLIVVVIIGILAAIAIPKFGKTREKAYFSAMKSDLKNLQTAEEQYYAANTYMYGGTAAQDASTIGGMDYAASQGVTVTIKAATNTGWSADATHAALNASAQRCAVFYGQAAAVAPAITAGQITCTGE